MKTHRIPVVLWAVLALAAGCEDDQGPDARIDQTDPARVTDLSVFNTGTLGLTLAFTAPGDDGNTGTAAEYEFRASHHGITSSNWSAAEVLPASTAPSPAGSLETFTFTGPDTLMVYYFAVRTRDESNNWSEVSNNAIWTPRGGTIRYVVDIPAYMDNTIYEESDTLSNAKGQHLYSGKNNQTASQPVDSRRGLIAFAVADSIPADAVVESAELVLNLSKTAPIVTGDVPVRLHRLLDSWGEGTSIANLGSGEGGGGKATPGDATWLDRFRGTSQWTTAGGDFVAVASATTQTNALRPYNWTSSTMAVDVQGWLDTPASNFGWVLIGDESATVGNARQWDSRENNTAANRPRLTVFYLVTP